MRVHFDSPLTPEEWESVERTAVSPSSPTEMAAAHASAARSLFGQPFGFTWDMLDRLWSQTRRSGNGVINDIAERIRPLLPPRKPKPWPATRPNQVVEIASFISTVEDAVNLARLSEASGDKRYSSLNARASMRVTALLPEAAANALLHHLGFAKSLETGLEKLSMLDKLDFFLQLRRPDKALPRTDSRTKALGELTELRNENVHIKVRVRPINTRPTKIDLFPKLKFSRVPTDWNADNAIAALRVLDTFLVWYFDDLCELPKELALRALSTWVTHGYDRHSVDRNTAQSSEAIRHAVESWDLVLGYVGASEKGGAWQVQ